ncbi:PKD domain-containing protein, partial [Candidatus Poribacteria bacterium]|nr:PKD domain-containing protein [Candidatus Poribacteria bacterium]
MRRFVLGGVVCLVVLILLCGIYLVAVNVRDNDNRVSTDTLTVKENNAAPTVNAGTTVTITEGQSFSRAGKFAAPMVKRWTGTVDYGDGSGDQPLSLVGNAFTLTHTYPDDGTYRVTVTVTDDDGGAGSDSFTMTVTNVAPTVDAGAEATVAEGVPFLRSGAFRDAGADRWTGTVDYGDGAGDQPLSLVGNA